jgi:hypothetical protein
MSWTIQEWLIWKETVLVTVFFLCVAWITVEAIRGMANAKEV